MSGTWPSFRGRRFFLLPDPQKLGHLPGLWRKTCSAHQPGLKLCSAWQMGQVRVKFPAEAPPMWIISRILLQPGFSWTSKRGPWKQLAIHSKSGTSGRFLSVRRRHPWPVTTMCWTFSSLLSLSYCIPLYYLCSVKAETSLVFSWRAFPFTLSASLPCDLRTLMGKRNSYFVDYQIYFLAFGAVTMLPRRFYTS